MKIKDGYTLDTNVSPNDKITIPVKKTLFGSRSLLEYLSNFDFSEIVQKKAELYGVQSAESANPDLFSEKEIEILQTLRIDQFGNRRNFKLAHAKNSNRFAL